MHLQTALRAAFFAAVLGLAACGGDDGSGTSPDGSDPPVSELKVQAFATPEAVDEGKTVKLSSKVTAGDARSFEWKAPKGVPVSGANKAQAVLTAPEVSEDKALKIVLTVSDSAGKTATDTVTIAVRNTGHSDSSSQWDDMKWDEGVWN